MPSIEKTNIKCAGIPCVRSKVEILTNGRTVKMKVKVNEMKVKVNEMKVKVKAKMK